MNLNCNLSPLLTFFPFVTYRTLHSFLKHYIVAVTSCNGFKFLHPIFFSSQSWGTGCASLTPIIASLWCMVTSLFGTQREYETNRCYVGRNHYNLIFPHLFCLVSRSSHLVLVLIFWQISGMLIILKLSSSNIFPWEFHGSLLPPCNPRIWVRAIIYGISCESPSGWLRR